MKSVITYNALKEAERTYNKILFRVEELLREYTEYQSFFRKQDKEKAVQRAEDRFYNYMYNMLDVGPYEEGKFSLNHTSLEKRMDQNRVERNLFTDKLKKLKVEIKQLSKDHAMLKVSDNNLLRDKLLELTFNIEEMLQMKGIEITTTKAHHYDRTPNKKAFRVTVTTSNCKLQVTTILKTDVEGFELEAEEIELGNLSAKHYFQIHPKTFREALIEMINFR